MLIGCDIDGVLFPWSDAANDVIVERFGVTDPGPHVAWDHLKTCLTSSQWRWLWSDEGQDAVFSQVWRTHADAVEAVNAMTKAGHSVHFVTHRDPRYTCGHTAAFLQRHVGRHPWAGMHVVQNSVRKSRLMPWDVFIDDKPETVFDFLGTTNAMVFAPARPWNVDELGDVNDPHFLHVYDDAADIAAWVKARS